METKEYKLENWSLVTDSPYSAPELGFSFQGNVYGHPRFNDGDFIVTTKIVDFENGIFITRSGSRYNLGTVDKDYERCFPNAMLRILSRAHELFENTFYRE